MKRYLTILGRQEKPFRFLVSRIIRCSGLWRFFRVDFGEYKLMLNPGSLSLALWVDHGDRGGDCKVIKQLLRPGETYVDVGANIGQLVMEGALAVGDSGKVFAFEAHPRIAGYLRQNIALNYVTNVSVAQVAVGNVFGWVSFSDERSDDQNKVADYGVQVPIVKLEPFCSGSDITLLKIDVEGFEKFVLEGLGDALQRVEVVYFEVMKAHFANFGYSFSDIFEILTGRGFHVVDIEGGKIRFVRAGELFEECKNIFAVRNVEKFRTRVGLHK